MLHTRLAVCIDKSAAVVTQLAVHVMITHNCLCIIYGHYIALMFFWISESVAKWNTIVCLQNTNKRYKKEKKLTYRDSIQDPRKCSTTTQRAPSWATTPVGRVAAKSHNELTYIHIFIYLFSYTSQPSVWTLCYVHVNYYLAFDNLVNRYKSLQLWQFNIGLTKSRPHDHTTAQSGEHTQSAGVRSCDRKQSTCVQSSVLLGPG